MTIAEKQSKIHTKRAKVELAIYDSVYKQQQQDLATKSLEQLINSYVDIEPSLLSQCHVKLGEWQLETLQTQEKVLFN